jgi:hypothetical protein
VLDVVRGVRETIPRNPPETQSSNVARSRGRKYAPTSSATASSKTRKLQRKQPYRLRCAGDQPNWPARDSPISMSIGAQLLLRLSSAAPPAVFCFSRHSPPNRPLVSSSPALPFACWRLHYAVFQAPARHLALRSRCSTIIPHRNQAFAAGPAAPRFAPRGRSVPLTPRGYDNPAATTECQPRTPDREIPSTRLDRCSSITPRLLRARDECAGLV